MEIFPSTILQAAIDHRAVIGSRVFNVSPPQKTAEYPKLRPSYETATPVDLAAFGPIKVAPLGSIVHARSGDKADNSNVGFFVRHEDEFSWLQSFLTVDRVKELLGDDWSQGDTSRRIERCEFPHVLAVHL